MAEQQQELSDFTKATLVRRNMAAVAAEVSQHKRWPDDFAVQHIRERSQNMVDHFRGISVVGFTEEQCDALDFAKLSEESNLRVIPLWLYPHLHYGDELTCIDGSTVVVGKGYQDQPKGEIARVPVEGEEFATRKVQGYTYIENYHRGGSLAYGIIPLAKVTSA